MELRFLPMAKLDSRRTAVREGAPSPPTPSLCNHVLGASARLS